MTSASTGTHNLQGISAGPNHSTAAEAQSSTRARPTLVFTRTPVPPPLPPPSQHGRTRLKKRPPTPGGPALVGGISQLSTQNLSPSSPHTLLVNPSSPSHPGGSKVLDSPRERPRLPSLPHPLTDSSSSLSSISPHMQENRRIQQARPSLDGRGAMASPPLTHLHRSRSTATSPIRTLPSPGRIDIPEPRPGSSSSSNLPDSPNTQALMNRILAAPDYHGFGSPADADDDLDDGGSETSSIRFASIKGKGKGGEIGAVVAGSRSSHNRRQRGNEKLSRLLGTTSDDELTRSRTVSRMASDGGSFGEGRRKRGYETLSRAKRQQRMSDLVENADSTWDARGENRKHVGMSGVAHPPPPPQTRTGSGSEHQQSTSSYRNPMGTSPTQHYDDPRPSKHHAYPASGSSSIHYNSPPRVHAFDALSPQPTSPRIHALDALAPNHGSVKRSQSASAVSAVSSRRHTLRSPTRSTFSANLVRSPAVAPLSHTPSSAGQGGSSPNSPSISRNNVEAQPRPTLEPPLVPVRSSSRTKDSATEARKATRRRSALLWMKDQATSIIASKSIPHAPVSPKTPEGGPPATHSNSSLLVASPPTNHGPQRGFSGNKGEGSGSYSGSRQVLGVHPGRSASVLSAVTTSSADSLYPAAMALPTNSATHSPHRAYFEETNPTFSHYTSGEETRVRQRDDSMEQSNVSPYYTVVGSSSNRVIPAGSPEDRWDTYTNQNSLAKEILHGSTVITAGERSTHKQEKSLSSFSFSLTRSLSKKTHMLMKEDKRHRNRMRGKQQHEKLMEGQLNLAPDRKSRDEEQRSVDRPRNRRSYSLSHLVQVPIDENGDSPSGRREGGADRQPSASGYSTPPRQKLGHASGHSASSSGSGGKFWKFVKRISSSGGLRDKYSDQQPSSDYVPPVPTLPPKVAGAATTPTRSTAASPVSEVNGSNDVLGGRRLLPYPSSPRADSLDDPESSPSSPSKLLTPSKPSSSSRLKYPAAASSQGSSSHSHLPSLQSRSVPHTRSSTPASAEQMTAKIAAQQQVYGYSSTSSLVDPRAAQQLPANRSTSLASDRGHLSDGGSRTKKEGRRGTSEGDSLYTPDDSTSWTPVESPAYEFPSLPTPPRRHIPQPRPPPFVNFSHDGLFSPIPMDADEEEAEPSSIPEFSVENVINLFPPRRGSTVKRPSKEDPPTEALPLPAVINVVQVSGSKGLPPAPPAPPPRPARDARRPPPTPPTRLIENPQAPPDFVSTLEDEASCGRHRPLTSSFGPIPHLALIDPRKSAPSPSPSHTSAAHGSAEVSPTREFDAVVNSSALDHGRSLTEKEKAEKWDALLQKSERAGGTLHLTIRGDRQRVYSP